MPPRYRHRSCSSSGPPMSHRPPFRLNKAPRSAHGQFAILTRRRRISRRWSATRWTDTPTFSLLIPAIPWPGGCAPLLRLGARQSHGGERASSIRLPPTGPICDAIRPVRTPPPPREEFIYFQRPVLAFDDPGFGFAPPPPVPVIFLAPPPPEFVVLAPPPPPVGLFLLPMPIYRPVPVWVRPPEYVAPPPNNVIYNNVHNTVVVNNVTNTVTVTNQSGQTTTIAPPAP